MKHDKKREKKGFCQLCGEHGVTHIHHVFGGSRRGVIELTVLGNLFPPMSLEVKKVEVL